MPLDISYFCFNDEKYCVVAYLVWEDLRVKHLYISPCLVDFVIDLWAKSCPVNNLNVSDILPQKMRFQ